jgi:hypothetical protein
MKSFPRLHSRLWHPYFFICGNYRSQEVWRAMNKVTHHWQCSSRFELLSSTKCRLCKYRDHWDFQSQRLNRVMRNYTNRSVTRALNTRWWKSNTVLCDLNSAKTRHFWLSLGTAPYEHHFINLVNTCTCACSLLQAHAVWIHDILWFFEIFGCFIEIW